MSSTAVLALEVLPRSIIETHWYAALSGFVAINTILYVCLSVFKIMPKLYLNDVFEHHGRRAETRSIYPNGHSPPADYEAVLRGPAIGGDVDHPGAGASTAAGAARVVILASFPRAYQRWRSSEESELRRRTRAGLTLSELAELHQRSPASIAARMRRLGL